MRVALLLCLTHALLLKPTRGEREFSTTTMKPATTTPSSLEAATTSTKAASSDYLSPAWTPAPRRRTPQSNIDAILAASEQNRNTDREQGVRKAQLNFCFACPRKCKYALQLSSQAISERKAASEVLITEFRNVVNQDITPKIVTISLIQNKTLQSREEDNQIRDEIAEQVRKPILDIPNGLSGNYPFRWKHFSKSSSLK